MDNAQIQFIYSCKSEEIFARKSGNKTLEKYYMKKIIKAFKALSLEDITFAKKTWSSRLTEINEVLNTEYYLAEKYGYDRMPVTSSKIINLSSERTILTELVKLCKQFEQKKGFKNLHKGMVL